MGQVLDCRNKRHVPEESQVFRIKVTLRGSRPLIWRRFEVQGHVTLYQLHRVLQAVMGWTDTHLHEVLRKSKDRMRYVYDFGDGWEHELVLEAITWPFGGKSRPRVLDGRGACPPEDVGGIGGYYEFLEAIANSEHPSHQDMVDWWGGPFDPVALDLDDINEALARMRRPPNH